MNILFVGVFDSVGKSTNTSQLIAFKSLGHNVVGYNYRQKALSTGEVERDEHICSLVENRDFDLVVFSKCDSLPLSVFQRITKHSKTCLWFMDPLETLLQHSNLIEAAKIVDYFCCDKNNVFSEVSKTVENCFHVCEGYDHTIEKPHYIEKEYDVSFIGNLYGDRKEAIAMIQHPIEVVNNAFGLNHSIIVSKSKVNLNFCTDFGASDRVYKIMAAGGFLLTDDWQGREKNFVDGKDLVIYNSVDDLAKKISYFLDNPGKRLEISKNGLQKVKSFDRINWAKKIIDLSHSVVKDG